MILTRTEGERQEIDLVRPTPAPEAAPADLPTPVCPMGAVAGLGTEEANTEPPEPGTSALDENWPVAGEGADA